MPEQARPAASSYRPDIDGLRAVAVLLVIARHLRLSRFAGGYIGVDVFFVISGYLISGIIMPQVAAGTFSLVSFYERRIRRIYPALLAVLAVSTALAWHFLFPSELVEYTQSARAALFGFSNLVFWSWAGYFDGPNELKPLLHTWSLGVEEQFYLVFPLFLLLTRRLNPKRLRECLLTFLAIGFLAAWAMTLYLPADAFYLAPLRAWELVLGVVLSQRYLPTPRTAATRNLASLAGLLMIALPGLLYTAHTPFPGLAALPPCLGAALILAAGESGPSAVGSLLSLRPIVFIGLISYSLYLWHWPFQVFYDYAHLLTRRDADDYPAAALIFTASLFAATLSWLLIERPIRAGRLRPTRKALFAGTGAVVALFAAFSLATTHTPGFPSRFTPATVQAATFLDYDNHKEDRWGGCAFGITLTRLGRVNKPFCLPYVQGKRHFVLIGDSHAADLWPGLATFFPNLDIGQWNMSECPIMDGFDRAPRICGVIYRYLYDEYLPTHPTEGLIVSYRWIDTAQTTGELDRLTAYGKQHHIRILVLGPTVEYKLPLARLLAMSLVDGKGDAEVDAQQQTRPRELDRALAALARQRGDFEYISFYENVCGPQPCPLYAAPGIPWFFDANHFTAAGSKAFVKTILDKHQLP